MSRWVYTHTHTHTHIERCVGVGGWVSVCVYVIVPVEDDHSIQSAVYAFRTIADIEQVGVWACVCVCVCVMLF